MEAQEKIIKGTKLRTSTGGRQMRHVFTWELKRLAANRLNWGIIGATFLFFMGMVWFKHFWYMTDKREVLILGTTKFGIMYAVLNILLLLFGMFLPFIAAEAVAHDYKQRVHEILMTTPIPNWAYIWGRYFAVLVVSLSLSILMFGAFFLVGTILHFQSNEYPFPDLATLLIMWGVTVLPATVLVTSLAFALGSLFPRLAIAFKLGILIAWIILEVVILEDVNWIIYLNPTSHAMAFVLLDQYLNNYKTSVQNISDPTQRHQIAFNLQQTALDVGPWVLPHIVLIILGLTIVTVTMLRFQRFRNVLN